MREEERFILDICHWDCVECWYSLVKPILKQCGILIVRAHRLE